MSEPFRVMLRRLRQERRLSTRELGRRAFVSQSWILHIEQGRTRTFSRDVVASVAAGMQLNGVETARLLIAAGFWPWHMPDAAVIAFVEAVEEASAIGGEEEEPTELRRRTG